MDRSNLKLRSEILVNISAGIILSILILSGPLVPSIEFTHPHQAPAGATEANVGTGSLHLAQVSLPSDSGRLTATRYGSESYQLHTPDAKVTIQAVQGNPLLVYTLEIPGLNFTQTSVHFPQEHGPGSMSLSLPEATFAPATITEPTYTGTLDVTVRANNTVRTVGRTTISIHVEQ